MLSHPALVHLPLGLALVVPIVALITLIAWSLGKANQRNWLIVILLQGMLTVGGFVAAQAGEEAEEEAEEEGVPEHMIEEHEEYAELFVRTSMGVLLLFGIVGFLPEDKEKIALGLGALATAGSGLVLAFAIETGEHGGEIVHGEYEEEEHDNDDEHSELRQQGVHDEASPLVTAGLHGAQSQAEQLQAQPAIMGSRAEHEEEEARDGHHERDHDDDD